MTDHTPDAAKLLPKPGSGIRWTESQIEELKRQILFLHLLNPLWMQCADAIGSLQFDLVDARNTRPQPAPTQD